MPALLAAPTFRGELLASLWIGVPIAVLFATAEILHHFRKVEVEYTRKLTHLGSGLIVLAMPWVVSTHWTVLALCTGFGVILVASKLLGLLPSIHAVERKTQGAQYYPVAVYGTFILSNGDPFYFSVPMMVMALSDTGAAVVGKRYGIIRYRVIEDYRSLGGSMTFFALTFAVVVVGLGLNGYPHLPSVLVIALVTSLVVTAVEGISVHGADNIAIPYATWVLLHGMVEADRDALGAWVLGAALVLALLLVTVKQARLNTTGFMAVFVSGVVAWGVGGPVWLATLLVPYFGYTASRPVSTSGREGDLDVMVPGFAVSLGLVLLYGHLGRAELFVPFLASVASISAIALSGFARDRLGGLVVLEIVGAIVGAGVPLVPFLVMAPALLVPQSALALAIGGALLGPLLTRAASRRAWSLPRARFLGVVGGTATAVVWTFAHVTP